MSFQGAHQLICSEIEKWESVKTLPHRFGGSEFLLGKREIGHIHGDSFVDIPFPMKIRDEIVRLGEAEPHHILLKSGWVSFYIHSKADVQKAISLLRRSYEIAVEAGK